MADDERLLRGWSPATTGLVLIALVAGFAQFGAVASLDDVAHHFGHPSAAQSLSSVVGLSGSALAIGLAVLRLASLGALPLASLADRWGRTSVIRRTLYVGLVVTAAASLSPTYWFFVACFALARPLLSASTTLVQVVTVELSSTGGRISRLVLVSAGSGVGAGLAAIAHGLIRGPESFRWLFAAAIVPVLLLEPLLRRVPEPRRAAAENMARLGAVPRAVVGRVATVGTIAFLTGVIGGPASGFTFVYGEGVLKLHPAAVSAVVTASAITGLAGLLAGRVLARRVGRRVTVALATVLTALTACLCYGGGAPDFVVGYMLGVMAAGILSPALAALCTELFHHEVRATAAGWSVVAGVLGAIAGLALFGLLADVVHVTGAGSFRIPSLVTFLPGLPLLGLLWRLPESSTMDVS